MSFQCRIARLGLCVALCLSLAAPAVAGELNIYFGTSRDLFDPVIQAFGATCPDIKISSYRPPTEELMATIELEIKAGKRRADVIVITASQLFGLQQQHKALEPYAPKDLDKVKQELHGGRAVGLAGGYCRLCFADFRAFPQRRWDEGA